MTADRGIRCPCGGAYRVTSIRKPQRGLVVRYRRCEECGARVVTEERLAGGRGKNSATGRIGPEN